MLGSVGLPSSRGEGIRCRQAGNVDDTAYDGRWIFMACKTKKWRFRIENPRRQAAKYSLRVGKNVVWIESRRKEAEGERL